MENGKIKIKEAPPVGGATKIFHFDIYTLHFLSPVHVFLEFLLVDIEECKEEA